MSEKSPLLLKKMRKACVKGADGLYRVWEAADSGSLPPREVGMDGHLADAVAARSAAYLAVAFSGARRASEVARSFVSDVEAQVVDLKVSRQKHGQYGLGQLSHSGSFRTWGEACSVRILSGWTWLGSWIEKHGHPPERMSGCHMDPGKSSGPNALFAD